MDHHPKNSTITPNMFHRFITFGLISTAVLVMTIIVASKLGSTQTIVNKAAQNCSYSATVKVKRADGKRLDGSEKFGSVNLGIINDKNIKARKADQELSSSGKLTYKTKSFSFLPYKRGDNSYIYLTNLNTDNWQVTGVFCNQLGGSSLGCDRNPSLIPPEPQIGANLVTDTYSWTDPQIGPIHLECGVNIEYGWIIEPITSEPPQAPIEETKSNIPHSFILNDLAGYASIDGSTSGGFSTNAKVLMVKNFSDKGPESLRELASGNEPKIIIFEKDSEITLKSQLFVGANTSILGLDKKITIKNRGLLMKKTNNVIIAGLEFSDGKGDAIEIRDSHHVWVDRITAQKYSDGLVDIVSASHNITVSRSKLTNHEKVMLIGNSITDTQVSKVTLWGNYFSNFGQRSPRVRYGTVDMYNNVIENWTNSGIRSTLGATVHVENNIFIPGDSKKLLPRFAENFNNEPRDEPGNIILQGNFSPNPTLQNLVNTSKFMNSAVKYVRPYPAYPPSMQKSSQLPYGANEQLLKQIKTYTGRQPSNDTRIY